MKIFFYKQFCFSFRKTSWIPGPAPLITIPTKVDMLVKSTKRTTVTYVFNVTGNLRDSILKTGLFFHEFSILCNN